MAGGPPFFWRRVGTPSADWESHEHQLLIGVHPEARHFYERGKGSRSELIRAEFAIDVVMFIRHRQTKAPNATNRDHTRAISLA